MGGNGNVLKHFKRGKKKPTNCCHVASTFGPREAHMGREVLSTCATRGSHVGHKLGRKASLAPLALRSRSSAVFEPPNSNFESVFRLRIVTPTRTTTTKKLCKKVEKSSRKMTTKTTQRMRTQSSVATSFGLETK